MEHHSATHSTSLNDSTAFRLLGSDLKGLDLKGKWLDRNTAILVIHGVGNQRALQTLDAFGQGLVKAIRSMTGKIVTVEHRVQSEPDKEGKGVWFNNYLRLRPQETGQASAPYLDVYEYYWAYLTEDKATLGEIRDWVRGVVNQAKSYYKANEALCQNYEQNGFFFSGGKFHASRYKWTLYLVGVILPALQAVWHDVLFLLSRIPIFGSLLASFVREQAQTPLQDVRKVLGDTAIYNTLDEKSKFNLLRREIMNEAISAIQNLIKPEGNPDSNGMFSKWKYDKVFVAGHSLGSEIGYDAINRINYLIEEGNIRGVDANGILANGKETNIADLLAGFITFGSPLDKTAFFARDQSPPDQLLRASIIEDFYGFRQKQWEIPDPIQTLRTSGVLFNRCFTRLFEKIPWRNYFDRHDPISGCLDLYSGVTNVRCQFKGSILHITHSKYWTCDEFYDEIVKMIAG